MAESHNTIGVTFGLLAPPFREQEISKYVSAKTCEQYQRESDAISLLRVSGLITDSGAKAARDKMYKRMVKAIRASQRKPKAQPPRKILTCIGCEAADAIPNDSYCANCNMENDVQDLMDRDRG